MPRRCTVCATDARAEIDSQLVSGRAYRDIAGQFGVSRSALVRHKADHVSAGLFKAQESAGVAESVDLLAQLRSLRDGALAVLDQARRAGDLRTALLAMKEARASLEFEV